MLPPPAAHARTVARPAPAWADYFTLLAAVRTDAVATAAAALGEEGRGGGARLVAVGDAGGRLYLFSPRGELAAEFATSERPLWPPVCMTGKSAHMTWMPRLTLPLYHYLRQALSLPCLQPSKEAVLRLGCCAWTVVIFTHLGKLAEVVGCVRPFAPFTTQSCAGSTSRCGRDQRYWLAQPGT